MKQNKKPCTKLKKVIDRGKRSKTLSEVKPVKNINKNLKSFLEISPMQSKNKTLADGLIERTSSMLDETESKTVHKAEEGDR